MQESSPNTEENSIKEMDALIKSIKSLKDMTEEQISIDLGYNEKFISQTRSRKEVSPKFINRLKDYKKGLQIAKGGTQVLEEPEASYSERSLSNLTESNKVLAEANRTLAEANKTLAEANHVISKNHDELIQLTKMIVGIHGKPSKKEDLREKTKKPTHS